MNRLATGLAFASALTFGAAAAQAEELSFAHFAAPTHTLTGSVIEPLNEGVSADTDGELTVRAYPGGELGKGPLEQYVRVVQGVADIVWGLPGYTSSQFQKTMIVEMPGVIPDGEPGYPGIWAAMDEIKSEFPATKPLAVWTSEPNIFIMKDVEVRTPTDLEGLKMRMPGLGGEVDNPKWKALWPGKKVFAEGSMSPELEVIKGAVDPAASGAEYKVDGLSGATLTSRGVSNLVQYWVGSEGFGPYLSKIRKEGV